MTQPSKPRNLKEAEAELKEGMAVLENTSEDASTGDLNEAVNHAITYLKVGVNWIDEFKRNIGRL